MKYSIKLKLFTAIACLTLFYVLLSWVLNSLLLDKYYLYNKKNTLIETYRHIDSLYKGDAEEISLELEKLEHMEGLHIIILDEDYEVKYDSMPKRGSNRSKQLNRKAFNNPNSAEYRIRAKFQEIRQGEILVESRTDSRLNLSFVNVLSLLNNGDFIHIGTPLAPIEESAGIANKFYLFTGILTIIIGIVFIFLLTGKFTKPILELKEIAHRMSALDFSKRYPVKTNDEIGQLGQSINSLSGQLQKSIMELKEANEKLKEDIEKERRIDE
ncbi:MAG: HAMP domain-containing protein, partial [Firmicutes bacterium]|nr:HAMP domain-containing protein [Bacillota bacterium]